MENKPEENQEDVNALETLDPVTSPEGEQAGDSSQPQTNSGDAQNNAEIPPKETEDKGGLATRTRRKITQINIYFILFIFIFVIAVAVFVISLQQSRQEEVGPSLSPQDLTDEDLNQITGNEIKVGDPKQTLNIESNAVFSGQVLIKGSLDIAGAIKAGGALNLPGITVSGQGNFNEIQANGLSVAGDTSIQGKLNIQDNLTVASGATFGGPISAPVVSTSNLQLTGNLVIPRHIDPVGGTPSRSSGTALGGGGTTSISGTDTAGTIRVNTGNSPSAGCFINVNFVARFSQTPHVVVSPVGSGASTVNYYVNKSVSGFSVCTSTPAPGNSSFGFDYIAID